VVNFFLDKSDSICYNKFRHKLNTVSIFAGTKKEKRGR